MARFITLFAVVGIASACQTNPADYLSPSEINLFSSTAEMMGRIASNPTNALNLHDHFCEDGSNRDLLISSGVKMLQQACFPDTSVAGFSLQSIMLELTRDDISRAVDCACTATKDITTSNADLNELIMSVASSVGGGDQIAQIMSRMMSSKNVELIKNNFYKLGADFCNGACRETVGRVGILFKHALDMDELLSDAEVYDPWDCMCGLDFAYLFDRGEKMLKMISPSMFTGDPRQLVAVGAKAGAVYGHFFLRPGGMCPKPQGGMIFGIIFFLFTTLLASGIAFHCMRKAASGPSAPKKMQEFTGAGPMGQVSTPYMSAPPPQQMPPQQMQPRFDPNTGQPLPQYVAPGSAA